MKDVTERKLSKTTSDDTNEATLDMTSFDIYDGSDIDFWNTSYDATYNIINNTTLATNWATHHAVENATQEIE